MSPVQKFNVGREVFSICFFNGSSYLLTAGHQKSPTGKDRTLCLWDTLTRQYLKPKQQWALEELNHAASSLLTSSLFQVIKNERKLCYNYIWINFGESFKKMKILYKFFLINYKFFNKMTEKGPKRHSISSNFFWAYSISKIKLWLDFTEI